MKKIKWISPILNLVVILLFLTSAIAFSTYAETTSLVKEWVPFGYYLWFSIIQSLLLLVRKKKPVVTFFSFFFAALKTHTMWLTFRYEANLGYSTENPLSKLVLVSAVAAIALSIVEIFTDNLVFVISNRESDCLLEQMGKRTKGILFALYGLIVVSITVFSVLYLLENKGMEVYLPFIILDGNIYPVPLLHNYYWPGIILFATILSAGIIPLTGSKSRKVSAKVTSMLIFVLGSLVSAVLCLIVSGNSKYLLPPNEVVFGIILLVAVAFFVGYLICFISGSVRSCEQNKTKQDSDKA